MGANCYVCQKPVDAAIASFPFCSPAHHEEWAAKHYSPIEKAKKHGRTLEEAIARCRELAGKGAEVAV